VGRELEAARARLDQAIVTWEDAARAAEGIA
jgi:hypothetical protein